jgi:hypothetical protein
VNKVLANPEPSTHGTFATSTDVRYAAAFGGTADIERTTQKGRLCPNAVMTSVEIPQRSNEIRLLCIDSYAIQPR